MSLIFSSLYIYTVFEVWSIDGQLQDTRNQYQLLQPTRAIMANANNKQQLITKKNNILIGLTQERQSLYAIIQHITSVSSPQIWFTDMIKGDKGSIQIKGWAATYPAVAQFMLTMEHDQLLIESALTNVEKKDAASVATFDIVVKPRGI
ncbi:MAG: PilN domain-containing protein [Sporomusaceae bacterium]|nr:PilN domain-containing protein [Sporomusaceae bacterium]